MALSSAERKERENQRKKELGLIRSDYWFTPESIKTIKDFMDKFEIKYKNDAMNLLLKHFNKQYILSLSLSTNNGILNKKYPVKNLLELPQTIYDYIKYVDRVGIFNPNEIANELIKNLNFHDLNLSAELKEIK